MQAQITKCAPTTRPIPNTSIGGLIVARIWPLLGLAAVGVGVMTAEDGVVSPSVSLTFPRRVLTRPQIELTPFRMPGRS